MITQEDIIEGNKIIARFMGDYDLFHWGRDPFNEFRKAKYHENWDALMPACKKFDLLDFRFQDYGYRELDHPCEKIDNALICYDMENVWEYLVDGIKLYNRLNKEQ